MAFAHYKFWYLKVRRGHFVSQSLSHQNWCLGHDFSTDHCNWTQCLVMLRNLKLKRLFFIEIFLNLFMPDIKTFFK